LSTATLEHNQSQSWGDGCLARPNPPIPASRIHISARQPLLYAALAFAAGLSTGRYLWRPSSWWVIVAIVSICSAIYFLHRRELAALGLCLGAIFSTSALTMQVPGNRAPAPTFGNAKLAVTAHVTAEGELQQEGPDSFRQRIDIETETLAGDSQSQHASLGVCLNIYSEKHPMPLLQYGQRVRFSAALIPPRNFRNPAAFDYAGYLREKGFQQPHR